MVAWEAARLMGYCRGDCDAGVLGSPRCPPTNVAGSTGTPVPVRETGLCQRYLGEVSVPAKMSFSTKMSVPANMSIPAVCPS